MVPQVGHPYFFYRLYISEWSWGQNSRILKLGCELTSNEKYQYVRAGKKMGCPTWGMVGEPELTEI
jgi:hypothetical protein